MTKKELIEALEPMEDDKVVVCMDEFGAWDNIKRLVQSTSYISIIFGGGSPFSGR